MRGISEVTPKRRVFAEGTVEIPIGKPAWKPRILITGGRGYIGSIFNDYLIRYCFHTTWPAGSEEFDVTSLSNIRSALDEFEPDVIIHCAAKAETEWCEDPENYKVAWGVNVQGTLNVVREALARHTDVIYFSSACLYPDNERSYKETDGWALSARCGYTMTKLAAELALYPYRNKILIIRPRQPFSNHRHERNLLQKLAKYTEFIPEVNSMTHLEEAIIIIWELYRRTRKGIWNIVNGHAPTILEVAHLLYENGLLAGLPTEISYGCLLGKLKGRGVRINALVDSTKLHSSERDINLLGTISAIEDCLENPCELGEFNWQILVNRILSHG